LRERQLHSTQYNYNPNYQQGMGYPYSNPYDGYSAMPNQIYIPVQQQMMHQMMQQQMIHQQQLMQLQMMQPYMIQQQNPSYQAPYGQSYITADVALNQKRNVTSNYIPITGANIYTLPMLEQSQMMQGQMMMMNMINPMTQQYCYPQSVVHANPSIIQSPIITTAVITPERTIINKTASETVTDSNKNSDTKIVKSLQYRKDTYSGSVNSESTDSIESVESIKITTTTTTKMTKVNKVQECDDDAI
jgi:hypothetical protein